MRVKDKGKKAWSAIFGALKYRNFRYFWLGQCVSLMGTWMQRTAQMWLVYTLTDSAFLVGLVGVCQFIPMFLLSLVSGVIVDRFPKKRLLIITQAMFMLQAFVFAGLTYAGIIRYWHILILSVIFGIIQTIDTPTRQAFLQELVGRDKIMNAVSLNSTVFNVARIIGPAISGLAMAAFGTATCFLLNGISFLAVLSSLFLIHPIKIAKPTVKLRHIKADIIEGIRYINASVDLRWNCLFAAITCTFLMNNDVIIPIFAKEVLGGDVHTYTTLLSAAGVGALLGSIFMSLRAGRGLSRRVLFNSMMLVIVLQSALLFVSNYPLAFIVIVVMNFGGLVFMNMSNSTFQLDTDTAHRGRVMSVYSFLNQGSTPIGNFYVGSMMQRFGGAWGFGSGGFISLILVAGVFIFKHKKFISWYTAK